MPNPLIYKGRASISNTAGRYEKQDSVADDDGWGSLDAELPPLKTETLIDSSKSVINYNDSPDLPFDRSINPYRGCEHGCIYCYARPSHAYLGLSPGLDFESRILIKPDAARVLREELGKRNYRCAPLALGTNTDPYQPLERQYKIMRQILEVLADVRHPVSIVTKSALVERDIDLLSEMAELGLVSVFLSVTTLDRKLARNLEPRAAAPQRRLEALAKLRAAGIPAGVMVAPVIPALNDHELENIVKAAHVAGAMSAEYILLRLPLEVADLFEEWLRENYPLKAGHVMNLVCDCRGGKTYDPAFPQRMTGTGSYADLLAQRFRLISKRLQLDQGLPALRTDLFRKPDESGQMSFDFFV
ncbi:MAG: PA0069 family radical SAM protein [Methylovulum sp.]|uniref:PA0069 family radical SAM protein n=1 Tax=Methylovulum sp. TaxID=1916980 RepID=UPI0026237B73|nr:PA0069 family radical SAM protein [Methylovulum sp.]MDD2723812.1 PA0069 family radical SAM protein [Methylovulum sp.]MDD5126172.1 PA0069 family radical SAM protein [Methylovulum sp.]